MSNYKGIISKIEKVLPIDKADNIQIAVVLGEYTIVSKSAKEGDVGILFPSGTQLSVQYCHENNLSRDKTKNKDLEKAGFFDDNRKVRCQKFLGVKSEAYFTTLDSVAYTGVDVNSLELLTSFESLNDVEVCSKFLSEQAKKEKVAKQNKPKVKSAPFFKEHVETEQFKHTLHKIQKGDLISIQSKRHGTSQRSGIQLVNKQLPKWKKLVNRYVNLFKAENVYEHVVGTRRVVLNAPEKEGFHGSESFRFEIAEKIRPFLSEGVTVYYEVYGWANGKPIMPKHSLEAIKNKEYQKKYGKEVTYSYGCMEGTYGFHIYRITYTTNSGEIVDLTQPQLVKWCSDRELNAALDVVEPFIYDGDEEKLKSLVEGLTERFELLTEDYTDPKHVSEGVIVRVDRRTLTPLFLKNKSFVFRCLEGHIQDTGEVDMEEVS